MLRALDFLAYNGIVHRDVKPENILYVSESHDQLVFQLGDFGLCNRAVGAATMAGSGLYMAPEMFQEGYQTSKLDVWSLFVTMLWTLDAGGFRQRSNRFQSIDDVQEAVLHAASNIESVSKIQHITVINPNERASAAQMLIKYYNGAGLTTPRNQVPALINTPVFDTTTCTLARPPLAIRVSRASSGLQCVNIFAIGNQYRLEKARATIYAQRIPRRRS
jgi:serine/threonine protein kinase